MSKVAYYTHRLLKLLPVSLLLLASCSKSLEPEAGKTSEGPKGDPVISVPLSINLGNPPTSNDPLESFDGIAPPPGVNPIVLIAVVDVATRYIDFQKMVEFKQNPIEPWKYDSQEEIPLYGGEKWIYSLYYPNFAGRAMGIKDVYIFPPQAPARDSEGELLKYTFMGKGYNPNFFTPSIRDFWYMASNPTNDLFAGFPIVLHRSKKVENTLVAYPMSGHEYQNTPQDAYNAWANHGGHQAPQWRYGTVDFDEHPNRTGSGHGTGAPDPAVSFNDTRKIQIGSYEDMVALNDPTKPLAENYNYNGVYKLPHNALASSRIQLNVDRMIAENPGAKELSVDIPLHRDYSRVRVFIAKDKDNPINSSDPNGPKQRIGLRGIAFVSMPSVASPSFRERHDTGDNNDLHSTCINLAGARTYNDAYAVEYPSGELKYPEIKVAPTGSSDLEICNEMRQRPEDYMFLLPQYIAPFNAPFFFETNRFNAIDGNGLIAITKNEWYSSPYSWYKNTYWYRISKRFYFPRILVATYYADRDTSKYTSNKSLDDPLWTHWVPFGERMEGIPTDDLNPETFPLIRSLYSGNILPGHTYDVFIILPTPEPGVNKNIKVVVQSWNEKNITIPDFE